MKHFLVEITYTAPMEKIEEITQSHRDFLKGGYDKGMFLMSGPQVPRIGGIIIARCESMEKLDDFLKDDPYRMNKAADYKIIEFNPKSKNEVLNDWVEGK